MLNSMANRKAGCTGPVVDILCMANRPANSNGLKNTSDTGDFISTSFKNWELRTANFLI